LNAAQSPSYPPSIPLSVSGMAGTQELQVFTGPPFDFDRDRLCDANLLRDLLTDRICEKNRLIILLMLALRLCALLSDFDRLRLPLGNLEMLTDRLSDFD